jgi:type VI secretion system secreted protein VgrG
MQEEAAQGIDIEGASNCRQLSAGHKFTLSEHYNANGEYVLTRVEHRVNLIGAYTNEESDNLDYQNSFHCIPAALPFRPERVTPKAHVWGTQTATVVGPQGEEISPTSTAG